jgi:stress response protein YsnF
MADSVIGLLADRDEAQRVRGALAEAGCSVAVFDRGAGGDIVDELVERGFEEDRAHQYATAVERGGVLVAAEAEDVDEALAVMNRFELRTPEELLERAGNRGRRRGREEEREEVERAQSIEEELRVGKEQTTGGKRLVASVTEREVEKPVTLREEEVEVERRRQDRRLSPGEADRAFREETVEMTATSERPVVSKEARVTGEVALSKRASEREEVVRDTLRRKDVEVETVKEQPKKR